MFKYEFRVVVVGLSLFTSGCGDVIGFSKRECAQASVLEWELIKDFKEFPADSDPIFKETGSEAWRAIKEWKEEVCEPPTLLDAMRGISETRGMSQEREDTE